MKILYVEDIEMNAKVMAGFVSYLWEIDLAICPDAESALELLERETFDLVYMDINLPGINGLEAIEQIRQGDSNHAQIPVIVISASVSEKQIDKALASSANDFIAKPDRMEELKSKTESLLLSAR